MNSGTLFSNPFESIYNIYRRHLLTNPLIRHHNLSTIHVLINKHLKHDISLNEAVKSLQPDKNKWNFPSEKIRQCEHCSKIIFHSIFYHCFWLDKCPIHNTPLTLRCQKCHHHWPNTHQLPSRSCDCCGSTLTDEMYIKRKQINLFLTQQIQCFEVMLDSFKKIEPLATSGMVMRPSADINHVLIPALLNSLGFLNKDTLQKVSSKRPSLLTRGFETSDLESIQLTDDDHQHMNNVIHNVKQAVMEKIALIISKVCHQNHTLTTHRISFDKSCIYCEAFYTWVNLVFYGQIPDAQRISEITPIFPSLFLKSNSEFIGIIPFDIQQIIFERDLECSFLFILNKLIDAEEQKQPPNDREPDSHYDNNGFRPCSNLFSNYVFFRYENKLHFTYDSSNILDATTLRAPKQSVGHTPCMNMQLYIDYERWSKNLVLVPPYAIDYLTTYYTTWTLDDYFPLSPKYYVPEYLSW